MKTAWALFLALLGSCASTTTMSLYVGERQLDDDAIEAVEEQTTIGLEWLWGILPWGLGLELGLTQSEEDGSEGALDIESDLFEAYVGARKTFREDHALRPYIGAGLSIVGSNFEVTGPGLDLDDGDASEAFYARAGVGWHFTIFHVGIDYRFLKGEAEIEDEDIDLDNGLLSIFGGFSF